MANVPQHPHLSRVDRSRPIGARRPNRRPTTPCRRPARFRTASGGGAERQGRRREELRDGRTRSGTGARSEEHTSELQSPCNLVCRLLLEKKKKKQSKIISQT